MIFIIGLLTLSAVDDLTNRTYDVLLGNRKWMYQNNIEITPDVHSAMEEQEVKGQTAVLCAIDGECEFCLRMIDIPNFMYHYIVYM